jgi:hypothetical protein
MISETVRPHRTHIITLQGPAYKKQIGIWIWSQNELSDADTLNNVLPLQIWNIMLINNYKHIASKRVKHNRLKQVASCVSAYLVY